MPLKQQLTFSSYTEMCIPLWFVLASCFTSPSLPFSFTPHPVTPAVWLLQWWISIMPRSPFIVVISLQLYWNWQLFQAITAMLIDSHFLYGNKKAWVERVERESSILSIYQLKYWHCRLVFVVLAKSNISYFSHLRDMVMCLGCMFWCLIMFLLMLPNRMFFWWRDLERRMMWNSCSEQEQYRWT